MFFVLSSSEEWNVELEWVTGNRCPFQISESVMWLISPMNVSHLLADASASQ